MGEEGLLPGRVVLEVLQGGVDVAPLGPEPHGELAGLLRRGGAGEDDFAAVPVDPQNLRG